MPLANVRDVTIHYEVLGEHGPWVALCPGGRRGLGAVQPLGERIAAAGYQVLLHDRRNCGSSDTVIEGGDLSEYEIWADDFHALLDHLGAVPVYAGGSSSGCRTAMLLALRHPEAVRGLLLWRVTGGTFAAQRLAANYYGDFIAVARRGGMEAVCATPFFAERIEANAANGDRLRAMSPDHFIDVMTRWQEFFLKGADLPVIGATDEELRSITVPACVIPGNDRTHNRSTGERAASLLPRSELHVIAPEDEDADVADWDSKEVEIASIFIDFLQRVSAPSPV